MNSIDFAWLFIGGFTLWFVFSRLRPPKPMFCRACGSLAPPRRVTRGSMAVEIILWLLLIVPGLVYSIWRLSNKVEVCRECGADGLIPPESPIAQRTISALRRRAGDG